MTSRWPAGRRLAIDRLPAPARRLWPRVGRSVGVSELGYHPVYLQLLARFCANQQVVEAGPAGAPSPSRPLGEPSKATNLVPC